MALDKLWTEAHSKVETKVADTKFLILRDVLAKEGKDKDLSEQIPNIICRTDTEYLTHRVILSWTN